MKYTAGELAKQLGVSARTVRFYDEKNLLHPCGYSEAGYRLYDESSAERLQKIIMLKFMDFSLEQICEMMKEESSDIRKSLKEQELLLIEKREHIERIIDAVRKCEKASDDELWYSMRHIIEMTRDREDVIWQYMKEDNLNKRISIHDYSTAKVGFYAWMLQKLELAPNMKIMDIGCGNAAFWKSIAKDLPQGLEIHLLDYSDGMLESARKAVLEIQQDYPEKQLTFIIEKKDATKFSYPVSGFDRIMANHMLYHVAKESRIQLYQKIAKLLADDGRFSCSLIGMTHLQELHDFVKEFYPEIGIPSAGFDIWLETAETEISNYFKIIEIEEQENDLLVPEEELVFDYICSYSKQAREFVEGDKVRFMRYVQSKMNPDGYMYIHKSTGIVICEKQDNLT